MMDATEQDAVRALALELAAPSTLPCARHLAGKSEVGEGDNTKRPPSRLLTPELSRRSRERTGEAKHPAVGLNA